MATTLSRIPLLLSFSSRNKPFFNHHQRYHQPNWNSSHKRFTVCFSSSIKRPRVRKKVKSNEELRSEIMEFLSALGFPEGHVPSTKELLEHGRNDLANIVRRRGYKFIRVLLATCSKTVDDETPNAGDVHEEDTLTGQGENVHVVVDEELLSSGVLSLQNYVSSSDDNTSLKSDDNNFMEGNAITILTPETEEVKDVVEDGLLLTGVSSMPEYFPSSDDSKSLSSADNGCPQGNAMNNVVEDEPSLSEVFKSGKHTSTLDTVPRYLEEDDVSTLTSDNEEVNSIVKDVTLLTDVDMHEHYTSLDLNLDETTSNVMKGREQQINHMAEYYSKGINDSKVLESDDKDCTSGEPSVVSSIEEKVARFIHNGDLDSIEDNTYGVLNETEGEETKELTETHDKVKIQSRATSQDNLEHNYRSVRNAGLTSNGSVLAMKDPTCVASANHSHRDDLKDGNADLNKGSHAETLRRENQVEINHLKFLLHQKELELSQLKEQIEKEKLSLSILQKKAETEIKKAQNLISEKDAELHAAEESLLGLQEVEIEYCGDGDVVEVMGSFNGWQHRIEMEPQPSAESRKQKCWSTLVWLYPGTYEIKFIVDGQWRIDPQKETVTKGHITNNILKVDR